MILTMKTMTVTIDDLYAYRNLCKEINAIQFQINDTALAVRSPSLGGMPHGTTPGDPTARAALRIIELEDDLNRKSNEMIDQAKQIETWIDSINDHEIRAIIRYHFLSGKTWRETALAMYGSTTRQTAQNVWKRWYSNYIKSVESVDKC